MNNRLPTQMKEKLAKWSIILVYIAALLLVIAAALWSATSTEQSVMTDWSQVNDKIERTLEQWQEEAEQDIQYPTVNGKVPINIAPVEQLQTLSGIGPSKAEAIVEYRNQHGPFQKVDELLNINGIGEKTLEKLIPYITTESPESLDSEENLIHP